MPSSELERSLPLASIPELTTLATTALRRAGASEGMARAAAEALVHAEACGVPTHGLARLSLYCGHLRAGRVNGQIRCFRWNRSAIPRRDCY